MDSSEDELDDVESMKWSDLGGATMDTREESDKEKLENGIKETLEFEEALQDLNMKDKLGNVNVNKKTPSMEKKEAEKKK